MIIQSYCSYFYYPCCSYYYYRSETRSSMAGTYPWSTASSMERLKSSTLPCLVILTPADPMAHRASSATTSNPSTTPLCQLGLASPLEAATSTTVKMMSALPFVPEDLIPTAWRHLKPLIPSDMSTFVDYYEYTWVGTPYRNPVFSHNRWNQHDATAYFLEVDTVTLQRAVIIWLQ